MGKYGSYQESPGSLFQQGLFEESSTQKHRLGTIRQLDDGRKFIYSQMGGAAGAAGAIYQSKVPGSDYDELVVVAVTGIPAVGDTTIALTNGGTAVTANQFKDGYAIACKGTGLGYSYKIRGNTADAATGAVIYIYLYDPIRVAGATLDEFTLVEAPTKGVIIHPSPPTAAIQGVATFVVTASYYCWLQCAGPCGVLTDNTTIVIGKYCVPSVATDGSIGLLVLTEAGPNTNAHQPMVGVVMEVGASAEHSVVDLLIR